MHDDQEPFEEEEQNEQLFYVVLASDSVPLCVEAERQVEDKEGRVNFFNGDTRVAWFWLEDVSGVVCGSAWIGPGFDDPGEQESAATNSEGILQDASAMLVKLVAGHADNGRNSAAATTAFVAHRLGVSTEEEIAMMIEILRDHNLKCPGCTELN